MYPLVLNLFIQHSGFSMVSQICHASLTSCYFKKINILHCLQVRTIIGTAKVFSFFVNPKYNTFFFFLLINCLDFCELLYFFEFWRVYLKQFILKFAMKKISIQFKYGE